MIKKSGIVKLYDSDEGFGYIETESGTDILVHKDGIADGSILKEGARVSFEQHKTLDIAINVVVENQNFTV